MTEHQMKRTFTVTRGIWNYFPSNPKGNYTYQLL